MQTHFLVLAYKKYILHAVLYYIYTNVILLYWHFTQSDLVHSGYTFLVRMCEQTEIEPTSFCFANAMLYYWATGTLISVLQINHLLLLHR